jgi:hypothetical protein
MRGKGNTRRTRRSREQWAALFAEQADSGLTQAAFCASRGMVVSTFTNAKRRLRETPDRLGGDDFVALDMDRSATRDVASAWDIELSLGTEVVLRIRSA